MLDSQLLFPNRVAQLAREDADRRFITQVDGDTRSYGEMRHDSLRWAAGLRALGVGAGDRVLTMIPSRISWLGCWLGLANIGAIDVGVNTEFRGEFLGNAIRRARSSTMLIAAEYLEALPLNIAAESELRTLIVDGPIGNFGRAGLRTVPITEVLTAAMDERDALSVNVWDTAAIIMTSGTTGASKYVMTPWGEQYQGAYGMIAVDDLTPVDVWYQPLPVYHLQARFSLIAMAMAGGSCVFRDRFSLSAFWPEIRRYGCTVTTVSPFAKLLWDQPAQPDDKDNPLHTVNLNPVPPWYREFAERFGVRLIVSYGSSEIGTPFGGYYNPGAAGIIGSPRRAYPWVEMKIVDEHDIEVGEGAVGELIVRSVEPWSMFSGYFDDPAATVAAWRNGWYHTGDAVRLDENGHLRIVDRLKDSLRRRNENISSVEVEQIVNSHPAVLESAAIGLRMAGEEDELKIVVVLRDGMNIAHAELADDLAKELPKFMIPRFIEFVEALPKTPATNRIQKAVLRQVGITPETWDREATIDRAGFVRNVEVTTMGEASVG